MLYAHVVNRDELFRNVLDHELMTTRDLALTSWSHVQVEGMLTPSEDGLQAQLLEIMRMLLDSETMDSVSL